MNRKPTYTDEELLTAFQQGGNSLNQAMKWLYLESDCRREILAYVAKKNGSPEDGEDVFQDGIKQLILNVRANKFRGEGSVQGYLYGMCRNLWSRRFQQLMRDKQYTGTASNETILFDTPESMAMIEERTANMEKLLAKLGGKCRQVLVLWKLGYSMKEIAAELGYKSDGVARKKKHQCFQKLLKILSKEPQWKHMIR
ncbi:MAG: sigma-70 family RNA polymerase sigma factor [Bacteroidota bacterium]